VTDRDLLPRVALTEFLTKESGSSRFKLRLVFASIAVRPLFIKPKLQTWPDDTASIEEASDKKHPIGAMQVRLSPKKSPDL
jgi:hypothetical protein